MFYNYPILTKFLFHGTSQTNPEKIYKGEIGFDIKYSRGGLYGRGLYFHERLGYVDNGYVYQEGNIKQVIMAEVIIGMCELSPFLDKNKNPSAIPVENLPPDKREIVKNFDSITNGEEMFIVYETSRAYPHWLITYS